MNASLEDKSQKRSKRNLKELLIFGYLLLVFGAYFLLFLFSRIDRIKALFGL